MTEFPIHGHSKKKAVNEVEKCSKAKNVDLQMQIKKLLDQRKPSTQEIVSLCDMYDDNLNEI